MKKVLYFFIFFLLFFVLPLCSFAETYKSEIIAANEVINDFDFGNAYVTNLGATRYFDMYFSGSPGIAFTGTVYNNYSVEIEFDVIINLYDSQKKVLDSVSKRMTIDAKNSKLYKLDVYEKNVNYKIDQVKFFSLSTEYITDIEMIGKDNNTFYYIENYNLKIKVNENNTYNIEENILATFKSNVMPIQKSIPLRNIYTREDGSKGNKRITIDDIEINDEYSFEVNQGVKIFSIGRNDKTNTKKNFHIKYTYNAGKDLLKNNDEFYYYLINDLDVKIKELSFEIEMPKSFDESNVKFVDNNGIPVLDVDYQVEGNVIKGKIKDKINSGTSYAIVVLLENNYFNNCNSNISIYMFSSFLLPLVFIIVSYIILILSIKISNKIKYNGDLYFTKSLNSLEMGYLYNGKIGDKDIATLIFWLSNKGYITIIKTKKGYKVKKNKEFIEKNNVEKIFMRKMFKDKDILSKTDMINSLKNISINISNELEKKNKKVFNNSNLNYKIMFILMIINIFVINTINLLIEFQPSVIVFNLLVSGLGFLILFMNILKHNNPLEKMLYVLISLILIVVPIVLTSYKAFIQSYMFIISYSLGIFSMLFIVIICSRMSDRTRYGKKMFNKIKSYKEFLLNCGDNIIDEELLNNKYCIYDVLPYAFVLGISDEWINKFRKKDVIGPHYYESEKFELKEFYNEIKNIYSDVFLALKNSDIDK